MSRGKLLTIAMTELFDGLARLLPWQSEVRITFFRRHETAQKSGNPSRLPMASCDLASS